MGHKVFNSYSYYRHNYPTTVDIITQQLEWNKKVQLRDILELKANQITAAIIADVPCYDLDLCDESINEAISNFMINDSGDSLREKINKLILKDFAATLENMFEEVKQKYEEDLDESRRELNRNLNARVEQSLGW